MKESQLSGVTTLPVQPRMNTNSKTVHYIQCTFEGLELN